MIHRRKDFSERKSQQRSSGALDKQPDDIVYICPFCGERAFYFMDGEYICKGAGHSHKGGVWIRYGDLPAVRNMIAAANTETRSVS